VSIGPAKQVWIDFRTLFHYKKKAEANMRTKILSIFVICIFISSCALIFKGTKEELEFESDPQRAEVYIDGVKMGETPFAMKLVTKKTYTVEFRKEGYKSKAFQINNKVGAGWIILDILGGLIPVIIDAATGAWYSFDQKNIDAVLEKQQQKPIDLKTLENFPY
jgi:hypothetical protein